MFVYATCAGPSGKLESVLRPSLPKGARLLVRSNPPSIFSAYSEMVADAVASCPDLEGVALVHDDVMIRDPRFEDAVRDALSDERVGVVGVIGGRDHVGMSWWETTARFGRIDSPSKPDSFAPGPAEVDTVDGLLMVVSPKVARSVRLDGSGFPPFHGYDSELSATVRQAGLRVMVADLDVYHDHGLPLLYTPEYNWAAYEWLLRWRDASAWTRARWRVKRQANRELARVGRSGVPAWLRAHRYGY